MIYTDIQPDYSLLQDDFQGYYPVDINNDGDYDFAFSMLIVKNEKGGYTFEGYNTEIAYFQYGTYLFSYHELIDNDFVYSSGELLFYISDCNYPNTDCEGSDLWCGLSNKYIGIKFQNQGNIYYGWILMKNFHTIDSYAINSVPNEFVFAGQGKPVDVADLSDFQDGRDLNFSFGYPTNESNFDEYRILTVKSQNADSFNLDSANNVIPENYFSFIPSISDYNFNLNENSKDVDGENIIEFVPYKVFLLCIDTSGISEENFLYQPSDEITLASTCQNVDILNLTSEYIFDGNYNINITFNNLTNENIISAYRIFFVNNSESYNLTLEELNLVQPENCYNVNPQGTTYDINLQTNDLTDIHGNTLSKTQKYKAVVMTVANGNETNVNSFTVSENYFTPKTQTEQVSNVYVKDVSNSDNISDLLFSFNKIADESKISEYRIILTKSNQLLNLETCENLPSTQYFAVNPQNSDYNVNITTNINDAQGDIINEETEYRAYILSVADGHFTDFNALSLKSNAFAFSNPNFIYNGYLGEDMTYVDLEPDIELNPDWGIIEEYNLTIYSSDFIFSVGNDIESPFDYYSFSQLSANNGFINTERDSLSVIDNNFDSYANIFSLTPNWDYCQPPYHVEYNKPFYQGMKINNGNYNYHGWVKLELISLAHLKIQEYAYTSQPVNIEENIEKQTFSLKIYPNPTNGIVNIDLNNCNIGIYTIEIYNTNGTKIYDFDYKTSRFNETIYKDFSFFGNGVYIVKIIGQKETFYSKFIKID